MEETAVEILHICLLPCPEEVGKVIFVESDGEVPDLLTDAAADVLVFWSRNMGNNDENLHRVIPIVQG